MRKGLLIRRSFILAAALFFSLAGCQSAPKSTGGAGAEQTEHGPPLPYGPTGAANTAEANPDESRPSYGPAAKKIRPLVLVLGPGMARSFAAAGVLRALSEARIPIGAIYGVEMGALIGAFYGFSSSINEFEWSLLKLKEEAFFPSGGLLSFSSDSSSDGGKLQEILSASLGKKDLSSARVRMRMLMHLRRRNKEVVAEGGQADRLLRAAVALPGVFTPGSVNGEEAIAATTFRPYPVKEALASEIGPVVVVNVVSERALRAASDRQLSEKEARVLSQMSIAEKVGWRDLQEADLIISPDLGEMGFLDFKSRSEAIFKGKQAVRENLEKIKELVGLDTK